MLKSASLIMTNVSPTSWHVPITDKPKSIGRGKTAEIQTPESVPTVSRRHAEIWHDERGKLWIRDLGSTCGTFINGVWVESHRPCEIIVGDYVRLGGLQLEVVASIPDQKNDSNSLAEEGLTYNLPPCPTRKIAPKEKLKGLTSSELDVLLWFSRGYADLDDIASKLHRSPATIRTQLGSIFKKLEVHSRGELHAWIRGTESDVEQ